MQRFIRQAGGIAVMAVMLLAAALALAQNPSPPIVVTGQYATPGTSSGILVAGYTNHTITFSPATNAATTGCLVQVDSAPTATGPWTAAGLIASTACNEAVGAGGTVTVTSTAATYARVNVTAITGGTISVTYSAVNAAVSKSSGGSTSGTVNPNSGNAGASAIYPSAAGSTTVGPDANVTEVGSGSANWQLAGTTPTVSTSGSNVNLNLTPNGTGGIALPTGGLTNPSIFATGTTNGLYWAGGTFNILCFEAPAGTVTGCFDNNGIRLGSVGTVRWSESSVTGSLFTTFCRAATGVLSVGAVSSGTVTCPNSAGFFQNGGTVRVATAFTTAANTNFQTITGLSWTPFTTATALNYSFSCDLYYSQATGTAAVAFGIQAATNAPTNINALGIIYTAAGTSNTGVLTGLATTTATAIVTGTPGAIGTNNVVHLGGTAELAASANVINIMVSTATSADAVTVGRGSTCRLWITGS